MPFAFIIMLDRNGRPVDPGWGVGGEHPDQGLPGWGGGRPDFGWGGGEHPGNRPPGSFPGHPSHGPVRPSRPTDPGYGVEEGTGEAGQLPVWPVDPDHPIAPPEPGHPLPPVDPPPGTIWPPLPPGAPTGKALAMVWIQGVGMRYVVITIGSETDPDYGVDEGEQGPEHPGHPDQGLPGQRPPVAGQPLPPQRPGMPPPQPGQPLPRPPVTPPAGGIGGRPPVRPGPPVAGPKR